MSTAPFPLLIGTAWRRLALKVRTDSERSRVSRLTPLPPGSLSTGPKDAVLTAALSGPRGPRTPAWRDLCLRQKRDNKAPFPPSIPSYWPSAQPVYAGKVSLFPLCLLLARTCLLEGNEHLLKRLLCPHHYCSPPFLLIFWSTPHGTWNPISPTRDQTRTPCIGSVGS